MAEYTLTLNMDPREVLAGFRQIEQAAQTTGQVIGQRLDQGVQRFSTTSLAGLQAELGRLQQKQLTVGVNTAAFDKLGQKINEVKAQLDAASRKQLSIGVDDRSITALQTRLQEFQGELNRVAIGSQRFRELQGAIEGTNRELAKAGESTDGFRLLDGVVQGVAFSLSNSVVSGAGQAFQALQNVVMSFAKLDTELRQAAAADGGAGAYDKIAGSVDRVGIEAAGSTQEVAQLATELIRGGMTADQVNASLGAIVRGAEATGTAYAQMGSNVSAALKGFGLAAGDAQRVVDALVTGANASATSVEGMGMAFKYAAPVARILGVSVEDLGVAVGLLTNAGIQASEAGVTLRNGLSKLASAAPQAAGSTQQLTGQAADAARAMRSLGINIYNADGTLKPMKDTLLQLKGAFDKLGPSAKIRLAASMFGGEDDGTKWLALLNQSNEEIIKMANTMASTSGATNKARDAMQGFELLTKQVDGTIGSLGNVLGKVTVAVLTPFVEVANGVLGVLSGLPGPVKEGVAAFVLLTGGIIGATAAAVVYQRVMVSAAGQKALSEVIALAGAFRTTLANGIATAAARLPALIGGVANLALRMGYLIIAFKTWEAITGSSDRVGQGFNERLKETQKALDSITPSATKAGSALAGATQLSGAAKFRQDMNGILNFVENFSRAADLNTISSQTEKLLGAFDKVQGSALQTFQSLKSATSLTGEQRKDISDRIAALKVVKEQADAQAKSYRDLAAGYRAAGKNDMADIADRNANAMSVQVDVSTRLIAGLNGIQAKTEAANKGTGQAISLTDQLTAATRERVKAESAIGAIDNRLAAGKAFLSLTQAISEAEQSRFTIVKAQSEFELKQAQARGAGEGELEAIRLRMAASDRASLAEKYQSLQRQQELQASLLAIEQEKARLEAGQSLGNAKADRIEAEIAFNKAATEQERQKIALQIEGADAQIKNRQQALDLLQRTQPLERQAAELQAQTARAGLQAQAAQDGYRIATNGSLVAINGVAQRQQRVAELAEVSRKVEREVGQQRLANAQALSSALSDIGALEQSRYSVTRSRLEFELQSTQDRFSKEATAIQKQGDAVLKAAEDRATAEEEQARRNGKSEQVLAAIRKRNENEIAQIKNRNAVDAGSIAQKSEAESSAIKKRIADQDRAALDARYQQLQREQQLELVILGIKQQQQLRDAQNGIRIAQLDLRAANATLSAALKTGNKDEIEKADALVQKQEIILSGKREELALIAQGQAVERAGVLLKQAAADNSIRAEQAAKGYAIAQDDSGGAAQGVLAINQAIAGVLQTNSSLSGQVSGNFDTAAGAATTISSQMVIVASSTGQAATSAQAFYGWLERASRLPGARWAGGGVEAGGEYRINELGQEAFLSAGRLSLIDAAPNSIWRAPADGVVIPAGVTARLQGATMPAAAGGTTGLAELAIEVGNLRQEVGNLARRDWSVRVTQRTGPTGSQVLRTLLS